MLPNQDVKQIEYPITEGVSIFAELEKFLICASSPYFLGIWHYPDFLKELYLQMRTHFMILKCPYSVNKVGLLYLHDMNLVNQRQWFYSRREHLPSPGLEPGTPESQSKIITSTPWPLPNKLVPRLVTYTHCRSQRLLWRPYSLKRGKDWDAASDITTTRTRIHPTCMNPISCIWRH